MVSGPAKTPLPKHAKKTSKSALFLKSPSNVRHHKFRLDPFLKGSRASKEQSSLAGTHLPYFRNRPQLLHFPAKRAQHPKHTQKRLFRQTENPRLHFGSGDSLYRFMKACGSQKISRSGRRSRRPCSRRGWWCSRASGPARWTPWRSSTRRRLPGTSR